MGFSYLTLSQWELILCCQEIKQLHENIWQKKTLQIYKNCDREKSFLMKR